MKWVLIFWFHYANIGDTADFVGPAVSFRTEANCEKALSELQLKARKQTSNGIYYSPIIGVCVKK